MVSAALLSELRLPGSISSLNQKLIDPDGKIETYLGISADEKMVMEAVWQDARKELLAMEAASSVSEELADGSVRIVKPDLLLEAAEQCGKFGSRVKQVLGNERGEAFLAMKGADAVFGQSQGERVYNVAPEATGDGSWRFRITLEAEGNNQVLVGASIPHEIRHLTDAARIAGSLEQGR